jgi:hypothetical protein
MKLLKLRYEFRGAFIFPHNIMTHLAISANKVTNTTLRDIRTNKVLAYGYPRIADNRRCTHVLECTPLAKQEEPK